MAKYRVVVTRLISEAGLQLLRQQPGIKLVVCRQKNVLSPAALKKAVKGADAVVSLLSDKITADVMAAAGRQLKVVANYAVGFDNIDVKAAAKRGIAVTNLPGASSQSVAEYAVALTLALGRRVLEGDHFVRQGKYKQWEPLLLLSRDFEGTTVGVVGTGRIGARYATMMHKAFNCRILYSDVVKNSALENKTGAKKVPLATLLKQADVVSLHVPLLPITHHLINKKSLALMKPTALLINTARGPIIDEQALATALRRKTIAGAAIDVFEHEPKITPGLKRLSNIILSPHIASSTVASRDAMAVMAAQNIIAVLHGNPPLTPAR